MNFGIQTNNIEFSTAQDYGYDLTFNNGPDPMSFVENDAGEWDYEGSRDIFSSLEDAIDDYVTYNTEG
jgi:hypothetical protein